MLPNVKSFGFSQNVNGRIWQASGTGTLIVLSGLASIANVTGNSFGIQAVTGGEASLPSLTAITNSNANITASGTASVISMPELGSFNNSNGNGIEFLNASSGGQIVDPVLTSAVGVYLTLSGTGSQMNTSQLASLTYGSISVDQTANFNGLTDIDGTYLYASNGASLSLPNVGSFAFSQNVNGRIWQASGTGTAIVLSGLASISNVTGNSFGIQAQNGGEISLAALTSIANSNRIGITATGGGRVVDTSTLTATNVVLSSDSISQLEIANLVLGGGSSLNVVTFYGNLNDADRH